MIERLPYYYRKSKVVKDFYDVVKGIFDEVDSEIAEADKLLFIISTGDFDLHEKDVGLTAIDADDETRRSRVITRLRGYNMLTVEELIAIVTLYEKSGCSVVEDYPNYTVTIHFDERMGIPNNIGQIMATVEEVKPAHIKIGWLFDPNTWRRAKSLFTWGEVKALKLTWWGLEYFGDKE